MDDEVIKLIIDGCRKQIPQYQQQLYSYCFAPMMKVCLLYNKNMDEAAASFNFAMSKVFSKIGQYKADGSFLGWVRKCVINTCINELKAKARFEYKVLDEMYDDSLSVTSFDKDMMSKEILVLVQQLPPGQSLVFNLYIMEGYTHTEISKLLGIPAGTSKWYLHEAKNYIKNKITQPYQNEVQ